MKTIIGMLTAAALAVPCAARADAPSAVGDWVTANDGAVVEIAPCPSGLCGTLVGLRKDRAPGDVPKDEKNSDPTKRNAPLCGLMMMGSFKPDPSNANKWTDGWAYDPDGGGTYSGKLELADPNTLKLRGYMGISLFGRTEVWTREGAEPHNRCTAPPAG